jgi:hypothetical protein
MFLMKGTFYTTAALIQHLLKTISLAEILWVPLDSDFNPDYALEMRKR